MRSFASALSSAFGVAPSQVRSGTSGLEIDRFDSWFLPSSSGGYMPLMSSGKGTEEDEDEEKA